MGKKYIIELEDKPFHNGNGDFLYRVKGFNSLVFDMTGVGKLTPYTEPDTEKVREEAFKNGYDTGYGTKVNEFYEQGLTDAWDAARNVIALSTVDRREVFGSEFMYSILEKHTASEAIEKIRQYEQEKEKIKVGDEVENTQTGVKFIVTHLWENNRGEQGVSGFNQECSAFSTALSLVVKTGRHFPEISEVLEKMREE